MRVGENPIPGDESPLNIKSGRYEVKVPHFRARRRRRMYRRLPLVSIPGYVPICWDTNDPRTFDVAFSKRLMRDLPEPDTNELENMKQFVRKWVREHINPVEKLTVKDWIMGIKGINDKRRQELFDAYERNKGGLPPASECTVKAFVKTECYASFEKAARMICSRRDGFKVFAGPLFKALEEELYSLPYFVKHMTPQERMERVRNLPIFDYVFETDFTAFESSFTPEVMDAIEFELYRHAFQNYPEDLDFLLKVLGGKNSISTRNGVKATVDALRMSGEMNTSLGNGFANLMLFLYIVHKKGGRGDGIVEGDDGLFTTTVELLPSDYSSLGFDIKIATVSSPGKASFCGLTFAESGQIIRDPYRFMQKFGWTHSYVDAGPVIMHKLLRAKALSALYETPDCPIVGAMAQYALRATSHVDPLFVYNYQNAHIDFDNFVPPKTTCPSDDTRVLFSEKFGISPARQIAIEDAISNGDMDAVAELMPAPSDFRQFEARFVVV